MSMQHQRVTPLFPLAVLVLGVIVSIVGVVLLVSDGPEMLLIGAAVFSLGIITLFTSNDRVPRK